MIENDDVPASGFTPINKQSKKRDMAAEFDEQTEMLQKRQKTVPDPAGTGEQ